MAKYFEGKIKFIDFLKYGFRKGFYELLEQNDIQIVPPKPIIYHYVGQPKPWSLFYDNNEEVPPYLLKKTDNNNYQIWWKYAKASPLHDYLHIEQDLSKRVIEHVAKMVFISTIKAGIEDNPVVSTRTLYDLQSFDIKMIEKYKGRMGVDYY